VKDAFISQDRSLASCFLLLILPDEIILFAASVGCFNLGVGFFAFLML
jgi:hypothetical protein